MTSPKYRSRVEAVLKAYEIFGYREDRGGDWVEFNARPLDKKYVKASAYVGSKDLGKLAELLGSEVNVTAYDVSDAEDNSDCVLYFLCEWK